MDNHIVQFLIDLETVFQERSFLTSKREMLGAKNKEAERFKTLIASILLETISSYYTTNFTEDNICTEPEVQEAVDVFNAICASNVYLVVPTLFNINTYNFWNDTGVWSDSGIWND